MNLGFKNLFVSLVLLLSFFIFDCLTCGTCNSVGRLTCLQGKSHRHVYLPSYLAGAPVHRRVGVPPFALPEYVVGTKGMLMGPLHRGVSQISMLAHRSMKDVQILGQG